MEPYTILCKGGGINATKLISEDRRKFMLKFYFDRMEKHIVKAIPGKIVAVGECGLDYSTFYHSDRQSQRDAFELHFGLAEKYNLPMLFISK